MTARRNFIKTALTVASGIAIGQASTVFAASNDSSCSTTGIIYTAKNPGKWAGKVGGHAPQVSVDGQKVTITTDHSMSEKHYIVRHTLVSENGKVLGAKTFSPSDDKAVSTFELAEGQKGKLQATSFCNKHDLWLTEFTI
jgi:superoxide reductase